MPCHSYFGNLAFDWVHGVISDQLSGAQSTTVHHHIKVGHLNAQELNTVEICTYKTETWSFASDHQKSQNLSREVIYLEWLNSDHFWGSYEKKLKYKILLAGKNYFSGDD